MSQSFDELPLYDPIMDKNTRKLSPIWLNFLASFSQTLATYLSESGIGVPPNTTIQRDAMRTPIKGQLIYNSTTNELQYYNGTTWVSLP